MTYQYEVTFAHEDETKPDAHGYGTADIVTDMPVETSEHFMEIARAIGQQNGFTKVAVLKVEDKNAEKDPEE